MDNRNSDWFRIRNNMRIGAIALGKDITSYQEFYPNHISDGGDPADRLLWWCEQLLKQLCEDKQLDTDLVPSVSQMTLLDRYLIEHQAPRNGYVKR